LQLERYVDAVISIYLTEHHRVEQLAERDDEKWVRLHALLIRRAFGILQRWPAAGLHLKDEAADFAQQACVSIFSAIFPFDVPFEAWATVILANHIRQRHMRSRDLIDRTPAIESLDQRKGGASDDTTSPYETLIDPAADDLFERKYRKRYIVDAIGRLSSQAQQNVVIYSYFYDWSDEQLAESMGKTKQAIYSLRHRALHQLRQILSEETYPKDTQADLH
jgi:RNA polymerase sigma factor (sigma-70 family)